jgi:hypothetical protein
VPQGSTRVVVRGAPKRPIKPRRLLLVTGPPLAPRTDAERLADLWTVMTPVSGAERQRHHRVPDGWRKATIAARTGVPAAAGDAIAGERRQRPDGRGSKLGLIGKKAFNINNIIV